jgi:hypothetical protein
MDIVEIMGSFSDFTETQAAYRKHAPNNTDLVVEVAEYIAHLERLDK